MPNIRPLIIVVGLGKLPSDIKEKLIERCLSRASIKGIGGLLECLAVQQALNIPGDGVGCHDERVVQRMDILTGHRTVSMTKERRNCDLAEAKIIGNARKTVPKDMGGDRLKCSPGEDLLPLVGKGAIRLAAPRSRKHVISRSNFALHL